MKKIVFILLIVATLASGTVAYFSVLEKNELTSQITDLTDEIFEYQTNIAENSAMIDEAIEKIAEVEDPALESLNETWLRQIEKLNSYLN